MPRQHRAERPRTGVVVPDRCVPRVHDHRHPGLGQQAPYLLEQRIVGREPAYLEVDLEDPRARVQRLAHVTRHPRLRVERRRRQAPGRGLRERQRPRVQVGGHLRPVRVGQRAEHPHPHGPQVRHPLLVAPLVADRPANPDQRPSLVEVTPHPAQHPRRQEMGMDVGQPWHPERLAERRDIHVLLRRPQHSSTPRFNPKSLRSCIRGLQVSASLLAALLLEAIREEVSVDDQPPSGDELNQFAARADTVPERLLSAARDAFGLREFGARVAELVRDSAFDLAAAAIRRPGRACCRSRRAMWRWSARSLRARPGVTSSGGSWEVTPPSWTRRSLARPRSPSRSTPTAASGSAACGPVRSGSAVT